MDKNNIFIESLYEFKRTRRSILFRIFIVLSIFGLVFYQFTFLSRGYDANSIKSLFQFYLDWSSLALASAIPFKSAYYFNIIQLLFIACIAVNEQRVFGAGTRDALYARPQGNGEIVFGNFFGQLLAITLLNWILFATSIIFNLVLYPASFDGLYYLFYWITLTFPTSVYFLGMSYLVARLIRNSGISFIILLLLLGGITFFGAHLLHGVLDPYARNIPNMFSDFTGHVNLGSYLLQRGGILLTGAGLLILSIIPFSRIPNYTRVLRTCSGVAFVLIMLAGGLSFIYLDQYRKDGNAREVYRQIYKKYERQAKARVVRNDLLVKELENGGISVNSQMTVMNKTEKEIPLVMYLNPKLRINSVKIGGDIVTFQQEYQVVLIDKTLNPGETCDVSIDYEGGIENSICFLEVNSRDYNSPDVNSLGIYRYGYSPAFCENEYKLLTPESIWYPVCSSPYGQSGCIDVNFTRYSLKVEHKPQRTAISQGSVVEEREAETLFHFTHDMPGVSLCIGNYKKRMITIASDVQIDSIRLMLYYLPGHEYLLEGYDIPEDKLKMKLMDIRGMLEGDECIRFKKGYTEDEWAMIYKMNDGSRAVKDIMKEIDMKKGFDPTMHYPYHWLTLLEVPCSYHAFSSLVRLTGEREQGGLVFIPEKLYSIKDYQYQLPRDEEGKAKVLTWLWQDVLSLIIGQGSCNIRPAFRSTTTFISSDEKPFMNEVINYTVHRCSDIHPFLDHVNHSKSVEYLKSKSLKEALHDQFLSPEEIQNIVRKKSSELSMYVLMRVQRDSFLEFQHDFLKRNLFKEVSLEEYNHQFRQRFKFSLDSLVDNWYEVDRLPLLDIQNARAFKIGEKDILYNFRVFNRSDVPGLVMTSDFQGWIIPPREGREIKARSRKNISYSSSQVSLNMPLAQNIPERVVLKQEGVEVGELDTTTGVIRVDSSVFLRDKNENEIIVDNEDPGFRLVKAKGFSILSLFRKEDTSKKYHTRYVRQEAWIPIIAEYFYGFPVQSAYVKRAGSGKQKVEWSVELPREGKYEVLFYHAKAYDRIKDPKQEFYYTVFDGKEEHEVVASINGDEVGWISLGEFEFTKNAKVILCDRDRKEKVEVEGYGIIPQELVADAVKWVPL